MDSLDGTARELVRELPKILTKTGDSRIDYLASNVLAEILSDLRDGHISRVGEIAGGLLSLRESLSDWGDSHWLGAARNPDISARVKKIWDLAGQFEAAVSDAKMAAG